MNRIDGQEGAGPAGAPPAQVGAAVPARLWRPLLAPDWLTDRVLYVIALFWAVLAVVFVAFVFTALWGRLAGDSVSVLDFKAFWAAAALTLEGRPALAYDWEAVKAAQTAALGRDFDAFMPWLYPPVFQLVVTPLGLLPITVAQLAWIACSFALYLAVIHAILPGRTTLLAALLPAPALVTLLIGQTGFLTSALTGLALMWWRRSPTGAGAAIGCLVIKPQLALALPVALLAGRGWRPLLAAAAAALGLAALSWLALGAETWQAFLASGGRTLDDFQSSAQRWYMHASVYGQLRLLGLGPAPAMAAQGMVSAAVAVTVWRVVRARRAAPDVEAALLAYACVAITPRVLDYDTLVLFVGALFQIRHARRAGFFPGECLVFGAVLIAGYLDVSPWVEANVLAAPLLVAALLLGERHRDIRTARDPGGAPPPRPA